MVINDQTINKYLNILGEELTIPEAVKKVIRSKYKEVCNILNTHPAFESEKLGIDVYAQGSYRLQTIIKPIEKEEFDLDFVFQVNHSNFSPKQIYDILFSALVKVYGQENVKQKKRCVRLIVAKNFYMDIIPAIPLNYNSDNTIILIPDKSDLNKWGITPSNPKGYVRWYKDQSFRKAHYLDGDMKVEPLPSITDYKDLPVLTKVVRLLKRQRDVSFKHKPDLKPISIILTTLCGHFVSDEPVGTIQEWKSIFEQINRLIAQSNGKPFSVKNPSLSAEDFSDKWKNDNGKLYQAFCEYIKHTLIQINRLRSCENENELEDLLDMMFKSNSNDSLVESAFKKARSNFGEKAQSIYIQKIPEVKPWGE